MLALRTALYFLILAILLRWPLIPYWNAIPMEPNFPLHALAALDLSTGGSPFLNMHLEWPIGAPVRYLAWPLLFLAVPINWVLDPIPAMNLATVLWLAIQGYGVYWLLHKKMDISTMRAVVAASLILLAPQSLISMGNGQFENFAAFPLLLCFWAASMNRGWLAFLALMACCFSSPYIGVVALLLAVLASKKSPKILTLIALAALATQSYYSAVSDMNVHESTIAAPAHISERATVLGLFNPSNQSEHGTQQMKGLLGGLKPMMGPFDRLRQLSQVPDGIVYDNRWPWSMATASSYLGLFWIGAGLWGLKRLRQHPQLRILGLWSLGCLLLSFGSTLSFGFFEIPMPWALSSGLDSLSKMQATSRFLIAPALVLSIAVALIPKPRWVIVFGLLCALESLLFSPAHWPIQSRVAQRSTVITDLDGPVIFWPAAPTIASHKVTMMALMLGEPLALFAERGSKMPDAYNENPLLGKGENRSGQDITEWKRLVLTAGVPTLIQFTDMTGALSQPLIYSKGDCDVSFCLWSTIEP